MTHLKKVYCENNISEKVAFDKNMDVIKKKFIDLKKLNNRYR